MSGTPTLERFFIGRGLSVALAARVGRARRSSSRERLPSPFLSRPFSAWLALAISPASLVPACLASGVATTSGGGALARGVEVFGLPETGADCAFSTDRPAVSAMITAMVVFIVFPFNSLRPVARLGHEAVDKAVERS